MRSKALSISLLGVGQIKQKIIKIKRLTFDLSTPPTDEVADLNVIKNVECDSDNGSPDDDAVCNYVLSNVGPANYQITVTGIGNSPEPSTFSGSSEGTLVQIEEGDIILKKKSPILINQKI